jgi:hypothetical protein
MDGQYRARRTTLEASYFKCLGPNVGFEPCSLQPGPEADLAATNVLSSWAFANLWQRRRDYLKLVETVLEEGDRQVCRSVIHG